MEQHPDLAKGFVHGDKMHSEQLWIEFADKLNASGPPTKPVQAWKKVWIDMKLNVKQRLEHNRVEAIKMTQLENTVPRSPPPTTSRLCSRKRKLKGNDVADVIEMESEQFSEISANIGNLHEEMEENNKYFKEISRNIRDLKRLKEKELQESKRHNYEVEKCLKTKNELKLKFLELERLKLGLTSS